MLLQAIFFSQVLRVLWPRKSNVIAGHLYSHIYFVPLSVSSLLAWPSNVRECL